MPSNVAALPPADQRRTGAWRHGSGDRLWPLLGFKRDANLSHFLDGKSETCLIGPGGKIPTESVASWFIHDVLKWHQEGKRPARTVLSWTRRPAPAAGSAASAASICFLPRETCKRIFTRSAGDPRRRAGDLWRHTNRFFFSSIFSFALSQTAPAAARLTRLLIWKPYG